MLGLEYLKGRVCITYFRAKFSVLAPVVVVDVDGLVVVVVVVVVVVEVVVVDVDVEVVELL